MSTPTQIIQAFLPAMAADPGLSVYLEMATNQTSMQYFQSAVDNYNLAIALRAMHMYTLAQRPLGESGAVTNKGEGGLSIGFADSGKVATRNTNLDQTQWGKQLIDLIKQQSPAASMVRAMPSAGDYISPATMSDIALQIESEE